MEITAALLASMTDVEQSVKKLVTDANLRLVGLLAPHQDVRESTAGSVASAEAFKKQQDVSQPPMRRVTSMTIHDPSGTLRPTATSVPLGRGKKKASEPILESSDDNDMPTDRAVDLYAKSASKKKSSKRQPGEGCSNPSTKRTRIEDPHAPTPTKETTPPPASTKETTLPTPVNQDPLAPVKQTPPVAPADLTPPAFTDQTPAGRREEASREDLTSVVLNSAKDRLTKITKHCRNREAIQETGSMAVDQVFNRALNEVLARSLRTLTAQFEKRLSNQLGIAETQHAEHLKAIKAKHTEQLKEVEAKHSEALKVIEATHTEAQQTAGAKLASLEEEMKKKEASIAKITASKDQYKKPHL
ncbi:uncharacterized protein LOC133815167 [Humulus lupulus]|uniref:uncharacterized protein LOC133815167 n=1 Tax=Humulus lupulus TaxID=3486 RepID=UPI002B408D51|nr:uncharacterized protein LOC133815167 [Humulus lupulus]